MLSQAVGEILPFAVGVALSPIPVIAVIVMLGTPGARSNGPAFAVGWVAGLTVVGIVVVLVANGASVSGSTASDAVNWFKLALGLFLVVLAARKWRGRPKPGEETAMPAWMSGVDSFTPGRSLVLGLALSAANPKNLALTAGAAASIAQAGLSEVGVAEALALFVVLGSLTVVGAVLFYLVDSDRAAGPLGSMKDFMTQHNAVIMMVVFLVFGAKLIGDGIAGVAR